MDVSGPRAAAAHPHGVAVGEVIAAEDGAGGRAPLAERRPAELAGAEDQRVVEEPARLEILDQRRGGPVERGRLVRQAVADVLAGAGAVEVPSPVEEVHEPHPLLDESAGEEAVVGEARLPGLGAVGLEDVRGLARDVHHLRHARLHPVGELVLRDARQRLGAPQLAGLEFVEILERVEALAPHLPVHAGRIGDVEHRVALRAALHPLIDAREESRTEGARAAVGLDPRGDEDDEAGEIPVLAPQAVRHPAPQARPARPGGAGVEEELGGGVVELVGVHAPHEAQPVGDALEVRDGVGELHSALAAAFPRPRRAEELGGAGGEGEGLPLDRVGGAVLAGVLHQLRSVVVEIEMGGRTGEVDDDHPLGARREVRGPRCQRVAGPPRGGPDRLDRRRASRQEAPERGGPDAARGAAEKEPSRGQQPRLEQRIHRNPPSAHGHMNVSSRFKSTLATTVHAARSDRSPSSSGAGPSGSVANLRASSGTAR